MSGSMFMAWLVMAGLRAGEHAERVNAAAELAGGGRPGGGGRSGAGGPVRRARARQARRYVDQAAASGRVRVPEASVVFTVKLPAAAGGARSGRMRADVGAHDLRRGRHRRWTEFLARGRRNHSPQVSDRAVETEFVFGRHAATELSVAYAILVPQRRARIVRPGQEGRPPRDQRGDLRPGLQRPAEERRDDRVADRGAARARRADPA